MGRIRVAMVAAGTGLVLALTACGANSSSSDAAGSAGGTKVGVILIGGAVLAMVGNGLGLLRQPAAVVLVVTGLVLLLAASVDALSRQRVTGNR